MNDIYDDIYDDIQETNSEGLGEIQTLDTFGPCKVYDVESVDSDTSKLDDAIHDVMNKLSDKSDLPGQVTNIQEVMKRVDTLTADNKRIFDLFASKLSSEMYSRARLKATVASSILMEKMADIVSNIDAIDYRADPMTFLLLLEKYMNFIEQSDRVNDKYVNPSVDDSIKNISENSNKSTVTTQSMNPSDLADLNRMALELLKKEKSDD